MLLCTEGLLEKTQELVQPRQTVSGYYTLWKIQYDTMKGISTTSETPTLQTVFICPSRFEIHKWNRLSAFCLLICLFYVPEFQWSYGFGVFKTMASLSPVIQMVSKDQPIARELNSGLHKTPPVFLCLLGKQDAVRVCKSSHPMCTTMAVERSRGLRPPWTLDATLAIWYHSLASSC